MEDPKLATPHNAQFTPAETSHAHDHIEISFTHHGKSHSYTFPSSATLLDLSSTISTNLSIPPSNQKFMITPKVGILKPPFSPFLLLKTLQTKKITLLAPTSSDLSSIEKPPQTRPSSIKPVAAFRTRPSQASTTYTFHTLLPLPYLPSPNRSLAFLTRLRDDAGIRAAMLTHKFSVGVLTEMNPAEHTTHESRTLGLNRNKGEVIELRLRTDAYDGYRDYKTIRKTLCHELAHNVFGEHDRDFWDLTKKIEMEVERGDWRSGGHALSNEMFYESGGDGEHVDGGGWTGGEYTLGETKEGQNGGRPGHGLSRREAMARAAEERMKGQREVGKGGSGEST